MSKYAIRKSNRSGNNICPICGRKTLLVEHHINGRKIPRYDEPWNIVWIDATCHDLIHSDKIIVEGWVKTTTAKRELIWHNNE